MLQWLGAQVLESGASECGRVPALPPIGCVTVEKLLDLSDLVSSSV